MLERMGFDGGERMSWMQRGESWGVYERRLAQRKQGRLFSCFRRDFFLADKEGEIVCLFVVPFVLAKETRAVAIRSGIPTSSQFSFDFPPLVFHLVRSGG